MPKKIHIDVFFNGESPTNGWLGTERSFSSFKVSPSPLSFYLLMLLNLRSECFIQFDILTLRLKNALTI